MSKVEQVLTRGTRARGQDGARTQWGLPVAVGGHQVHRAEDCLCAVDAVRMGQTLGV